MAEVKRYTSSEKFTRRDSNGRWTVPKGNDVQGVTRDASRQVIKNYKPALEKLKKH